MGDEEVPIESLVEACEDCPTDIMKILRLEAMHKTCSYCKEAPVVHYKDVSQDECYCFEHIDKFKLMVQMSTDAKIDYVVFACFRNGKL